MAAGLERDVGGCAFGGEAASGGLFEGHDFGVVAVVVEVRAFADDLRRAAAGGILREDTAYLRVGGGEADGLGGEVERSLHEDFVLGFFVLGERAFSRHSFEGIESSVPAAMTQRCELILWLAGAWDCLISFIC